MKNQIVKTFQSTDYDYLDEFIKSTLTKLNEYENWTITNTSLTTVYVSSDDEMYHTALVTFTKTK